MPVDAIRLAVETAQALGPHLSVLLGFATVSLARGALQKAGGDTYEYARGLWQKVSGKRSKLDAAAENAAEHGDDEDALIAFRIQLEQLFREQAELAQEVEDYLSERPGSTVVASGERSVALSQAKYIPAKL
jgi:hypothetical protein